MVHTRAQIETRQRLFGALCDDGGDVETLLGGRADLQPSSLVVADNAGDLTALHVAAATNSGGLAALLAVPAARSLLDAQLGVAPPPPLQPAWLQQLKAERLNKNQLAALQPGMTALGVACRLGHIEAVQALLSHGADPNAAGPVPLGQPRPWTPLSAVVLSSEGAGGADGATAARIADLLLQHGADPLAPSVRRRCSTLRCACGSEFLPNQTLALLLAHLERQLAAGSLALGSGDTAAEVMVGAARCGRLCLFRCAHEYVLAACGLRPSPALGGSGRARAAAGTRRAIDSSSSSSSSCSSEEDGEEGSSGGGGSSSSSGGSGIGAELAARDGDGSQGWLSRVAQGSAPRWQPSSQQLFEVLRGAALGGSIDILQLILRSPLPFNVPQADAVGKGLMAHSAAHGGSAATVALLHRAGGRLDLQRLLYVLERTVAAAPVQALLACERPQVSEDTATIKAGGVVSFTCPIHRLLHIHKRGAHPAADAAPAAWPRQVMLLLESLLEAGYRPTIYRGIRTPTFMMIEGVPTQVGDPWDPLDQFPSAGPADRRLLLVARQGGWGTAAHADWPDAFKAAVRTLLLAAHRLQACRGQSGCGNGSSVAQRAQRRQRGKAPRLAAPAVSGATLGSLPWELLGLAISAAALPMSSWM